MSHVRRFASAALGLLIALSGCMQRWRPPIKPPQPVTQPAALHIGDYLRANAAGEWVYDRTDLPPHTAHAAPVRYVRRVNAHRLVEGVLADRSFLPVERYLHEGPTSRPAEQVPTAPLRDGTGIFFELEPALESIPVGLEFGRPDVALAEIRYYDRLGRPGDRGRLTRTAEIEGLEDVDCPAGHFEKCVRVRVDLEIRFPWGPAVDWTSYLWLSPQVGEVQRVQHMNGFFWILWFSSSYEYRLVSHRAVPMASMPTPEPVFWSRGAVLFTRGIPHPEIGGMLVDFNTMSSEPARQTRRHRTPTSTPS